MLFRLSCSLLWICLYLINGIETFDIQVQIIKQGELHPETITFEDHGKYIEYQVIEFCEKYDIVNRHCKQVMQLAYEKYKETKQQHLRNITLLPSKEEDLYIPNMHLVRYPGALLSEMKSLNKVLLADDILQRETTAINAILKIIQTNLLNQNIPIKRITFIHSCLFENQPIFVLDYLLTMIRKHNLEDELDMIIVLHFGIDLPVSFIDKYPNTLFLQISSDASFFELPSLRILHAISKALLHINQSPQVLYLHTKGVSYQTMYPQIQDWIDMMLYYLVEQHNACFHLLQSGLYDAIGTNYFKPPRMFSGNFWWSTGSYLAKLPSINYQTTDKYDAEHWLFASLHIRIYIAHNSMVFHEYSRYPRYCYASISQKEEIPSWLLWSEICKNQDKGQYQLLHYTKEYNSQQYSSDLTTFVSQVWSQSSTDLHSNVLGLDIHYDNHNIHIKEKEN